MSNDKLVIELDAEDLKHLEEVFRLSLIHI